MKDSKSWLERRVALCLVMALVVPLCAAETAPELGGSRQTVASQPNTSQPPPADQARTSGAADATSPAPYPDSPGTLRPQSADQNSQTPQSQTPPPAQNEQNDSTSSQTGTAAAPYQKQEGVSASKPAGAAIAAGKQRRIRTYAIRVGLLVGAAIAIGVVSAASLGSSGRP